MHTSNTTGQPWEKMVSDFLLHKPRKPLIVIIGPTASGKTALSIELSLWLLSDGRKSEVINADSRQFFRGLDIGTAKIRSDEMRGVPHHLLSVLDPDQESSISWYQEKAHNVIQKIHHAGSVPILVGGSMLYVSSVVDGLVPIPTDTKLREELRVEYDRDAGVSLHARLASLDPETAAATPRENRVYVVRAMEIIHSTGKTKREALTSVASPYDLLLLGLSIDRKTLRNRLQIRTQAMLENGWIDEVKTLISLGYGENTPAMQSHGYREIMATLKEERDPKSVLEDVVNKGMQYAKRHQTWWNKDPRVQWLQAAI